MTYCIHPIEKTLSEKKKYKPRTMRHTGTLGGSTGTLGTQFLLLIFKISSRPQSFYGILNLVNLL